MTDQQNKTESPEIREILRAQERMGLGPGLGMQAPFNVGSTAIGRESALDIAIRRATEATQEAAAYNAIVNALMQYPQDSDAYRVVEGGMWRLLIHSYRNG